MKFSLYLLVLTVLASPSLLWSADCDSKDVTSALSYEEMVKRRLESGALNVSVVELMQAQELTAIAKRCAGQLNEKDYAAQRIKLSSHRFDVMKNRRGSDLTASKFIFEKLRLLRHCYEFSKDADDNTMKLCTSRLDVKSIDQRTYCDCAADLMETLFKFVAKDVMDRVSQGEQLLVQRLEFRRTCPTTALADWKF